MKRLLAALLATSTVAIAAPALAHGEGDDDWSTSAPTYGEFDQQYHHIWDGIQHGLSDGSYTQWQARQFYRELQSIRARAWWEQNRGYYNPQDIEYRLESLHTRMHVAHDQGHERLNNDWYGYGGDGGYGGYGGNGYSPYRRW